MKNKLQNALLLAGTLTCMHIAALAQSPTVKWEATFGGTNDNVGGGECGYKVLNTASGGYVVCGLTYATDIPGGKGGIDAAIVVYDSAGTKLWNKSYGGTGGDGFSNMDITSNGDYIFSGFTTSTNGDVSGNHGAQDIWIVKTNDTGAILWQKCFGGTAADGIKSATAGGNFRQVSIKALDGGGYILSAPTASTNGDISGNHGGFDVWVAKLNDTGAVVWQHCYGGTANDYPTGEIYTTADGGYVVGGTTESSNGDVTGYHGGSDMWLVKIDSLGNLQWQKSLGGSGLDLCTGGVLPVDNGYVMTGTSRSSDGDVNALGGGTYDWWAIKVNDTGAVVWSKSYGNTGTFTYDFLLGSIVAKDGGLILSGVITGCAENATSPSAYDGIGTGSNVTGPLFGAYDGWLVKVSASTGDIVWQKNVGTDYNEQFQNVIQRNDGTITATGYTDPNVPGSDWWTVHLSACPSYSYVTDTLCKGSVLTFGTQQLTVAGTYVDTLVMIENGCDSLVALTLVIDSVVKPVITANGTLLSTGTYHSYQWLDGSNNPIPNATTQSYQPTVSGNYKVVVGNERGCSDTSVAYVSQITGLTEPAALAGLKLYPNPGTHQLYLDIPAGAGEGIITIMGIDGSAIQDIQIEKNKLQYIIPAGTFSPGIYLVKITTEQGVVIRKWAKQ